MSDIFREVDEDIRKEKYRRLWDRYGIWAIMVAVLIVAGTGGYRGWIYWQDTQSQNAGDMFFEAVTLSEEGNVDEALAIFAELQDSVGGYPQIARLREATELARTGRQTEALGIFDSLSRDSNVDRALQSVASIRAGYLAVDLEDYTGVADRVEGLTGPDDPFRAAARELLALSAWNNGDVETARRWISAIQDDPATPTGVTQRVSILSEVIRARYGAPSEQGTGASE
ncbi:MAG: tetratricopeptide repeat protein [Roseibium sp.]|nr:tetratricopeptide repeat protein [Roseibium sp.]